MKKKLGGLLLNLQLLKSMFSDKGASKWPKILLVLAIIYLFIPTVLVPYLSRLSDYWTIWEYLPQ
ncbi:MAG: hypothetical protein LIO93_06555 [Bacteroidales bacterium]|nr:hypothetical protein [Bacteroidales bacterium]